MHRAGLPAVSPCVSTPVAGAGAETAHLQGLGLILGLQAVPQLSRLISCNLCFCQ